MAGFLGREFNIGQSETRSLGSVVWFFLMVCVIVSKLLLSVLFSYSLSSSAWLPGGQCPASLTF